MTMPLAEGHNVHYNTVTMRTAECGKEAEA